MESKLTEYQYAEIAEIGTFTFENYPKDIPDSLTRKVKLTQQKITQDGNTYTTNYLAHDLYGRPTLIQETFAGKSKYTKLGYYDEKDNWILGLPTTVKISDNNSASTTVSEIVYHDGTTAGGAYAGLGLPYEQSAYGRWVKRFTRYSSEGNLEQEEYNVARTVGAGNRFTQYSNYKRGIAQTVTVPAPSGSGTMSKSRVVDNNGWITRETDFNGVSTHYQYDSLGRIKSVDYAKDPTGNIDWQDELYSWSEDSDGRQTRTLKRCVLDITGSSCQSGAAFTQTESYDGLLRLAKRSQNDGSTTRHQYFKYDKDHRQTFASHWSSSNAGESKGTARTFDGLGRLQTLATSGLGTIAYEYQAGNKIKVTDGEGNVTVTSYLAYGAPSYEQAIRIFAPENVTTAINRDILGLITSINQFGYQKDGVTLATQTETRLYDSYKQLCLVKRDDVGNTAYQKNALGETNWMAQGVSNTACTTSKPATAAVSYTLDNLGNVKAINYPDSASADVSYERDNNGNVLKLTAGTVSHSYGYNNQNLLTSESLSIGSEKNLALAYGYTAMMHRNDITYPDGTRVYSKPNAFGWPSEIKAYNGNTLVETFAGDVSHYLTGQLTGFTYGNGISHETSLHPLSLLPSRLLDVKGGSTVMDLGYSYDGNANITAITDGQNLAYSLSKLTYDGLNRLVSTTGGSGIGSSAISYDSLGNITAYSSKNSALSYSYDYSKNRLTSVSGSGSQAKSYGSFTYDSRGNITHNSHRALAFNRANQLYQSGSNTYLYDGFNRRVKQTDAKGTSYSLYGQDGTLLYRETDVVSGKGNGINYIYLGKKLIAKTVEKTPEANSRQHYKPFGSTIETPKDGVGYTGHKFDTDLGLNYMQARYYDPVIGRFYSNDPIGFRDIYSFNRYAYANNNPYRYTDPTGQSSVEFKPIPGVTIAQNREAHGAAASFTPGAGFVEAVGQVADGQYAQAAVSVATELPLAKTAKLFKGAKGSENLIYRSASGTPNSMTPRPKDSTGLSAANSLENALPGKQQVIDTSKLKNLCAVCDNPKTGHVSITPKDMSQMQGWIDSRGSGTVHPLTQELMEAVVDTVKK